MIIGQLNELAPSTPGAGQVRVASGWAIVDGHPYWSSANVDFTPTTPGIGTTGHRIVLRASWAAQTVRLTDISSADGTAAIPAMTQTPGTTYDIPIMSFTKSTGGAIASLADTRDFAGPSVFDMIRGAWRQPGRRLVAWATPMQSPGTVSEAGVGIGVGYVDGSGGGGATLTTASGEPVLSFATNAAVTRMLGVNVAVLAPNKSPRMLVRVMPPASNANITVWQVGFIGSQSATANGAYLRCVTTGNLFFVTRQGGTETVTDLGTRPAVLTSYEIYTDDAGVTWVCRNTTTGSIVATHTSNVPTAATALMYALHSEIIGAAAGAAGQFAYGQVEATFTP